ncbi:hypothetical protein LCGC14_0801510 [marine sediment metagenome]|uniref:Uncharacterized protein n=1 Tax=marine sediment metagenome TaxID=412755 RepID=A0A0F9SWK0_9ZZZZ
MNEKEEPVVNEKEIQAQEIKELTEEIQEDNKEIYDIMKKDSYKTLFQAVSRALHQTLENVILKIEITNLNKISSRPIPEEIKNDPGPEDEKVKSNSSGKKSTTTKKEDKIPDFPLENVDVKHRTDKAILLINVDDKVAWIPNKAMKDMNEKERTAVIHGWFVSKIEWKDQEPFNP